jgi:hypothetical protein
MRAHAPRLLSVVEGDTRLRGQTEHCRHRHSNNALRAWRTSAVHGCTPRCTAASVSPASSTLPSTELDSFEGFVLAMQAAMITVRGTIADF